MDANYRFIKTGSKCEMVNPVIAHLNTINQSGKTLNGFCRNLSFPPPPSCSASAQTETDDNIRSGTALMLHTDYTPAEEGFWKVLRLI